MKAIEFIKKELHNIHNLLPFVKMKYEYDTISLTHIVEVTPLSVYKDDKRYEDLELKLMDAFIDHYPDEDILFVSEESLIRVENPIFELNSLKVSMDSKEPLSTEFIFSYNICLGSYGQNLNYSLAA